MRRHSVLRCAIVACTISACTAAGSDNQVFGPVFEPGADAAGGDASVADAAATTDALADASVPDAASDTSTVDATPDAPSCDPRLAIVTGGATSAQGANPTHRMYVLKADTQDPLGTWTMQVWHEGRVIIERQFELYKP